METFADGTSRHGKTTWKDAAAAAFETLKREFGDARRRHAFRGELAALDRLGLLDALLDDLGITRWELNKAARSYPEAERLLQSMAYHCDVALDALDSHVRDELRQTCALCDSHRACRRFLAAGGGDSSFYCPNAALFGRLRSHEARL
ncbi:MAG TPA: DUF6455 family protein [Stellaceae bacterium]|jgi:uncharacterized protein YjiS (DUF1127 family)|nr:DUF6455 family protein [Stellaceae bacterium]